MVDFQYKEMKNLKILPNIFLCLSINIWINTNHMINTHYWNNTKKNVITNHDSTIMSKRIAKFKSNYKNVRI